MIQKLREQLANSLEESMTLHAQLEEMTLEFGNIAQAYQETQESNHKLIHQLNEKDDANTALVAEGTTQRHALALLKEEKDKIKRLLDSSQKMEKSLVEKVSGLEGMIMGVVGRVGKLEGEVAKAENEVAGVRGEWGTVDAVKRVSEDAS